MYYPLLFHPLDFFGHVVDELLAAEDLDVVVESEHEAAYAEKYKTLLLFLADPYTAL